MVKSSPDRDVVSVIFEALRALQLEPRLIPHGMIEELRGGVQCFDVKKGEGVDAAILLSRVDIGALPINPEDYLYKVDYAVRGTIKGVLPDRILSRTVLRTEGLLKKRVVGISWETPVEEREGPQIYRSPGAGGKPPSRGELWEGGPHQMLTEKLNGDRDLAGAIKTFPWGDVKASPIFSVFSDGWGESIRIRGDPWLRNHDLPLVYVSTAHLNIVNKIVGHVKEVRRRFGGLTF